MTPIYSFLVTQGWHGVTATRVIKGGSQMTPLELARQLHAGTDGQFMADALLSKEQIIRALCIQAAVDDAPHPNYWKLYYQVRADEPPLEDRRLGDARRGYCGLAGHPKVE